MIIDWNDVLNAAWRHKASVFAAFLFGIVFVWSIFFVMTPKYASSALVLAQSDAPINFNKAASTTADRTDEYLSSQVEIITSQAVIMSAIRSVGVEALVHRSALSKLSDDLVGRLKSTGLETDAIDTRPAEDPLKNAFQQVQRSLSVEAEPRTDLIKVTFTDRDPNVAMAFVKALVASFLDRRIRLSVNGSAASFARTQLAAYDTQLQAASAKLSDFSKSSGIYSTDDQQKLLLTRRSEAVTAIAATTSSIAEKEAHAQALGKQLATLKLTNLSSQISALAHETLGSEPAAAAKSSAGSGGFLNGDPPLLLVRVYQDSVENLVTVNADLAGLKAIYTQQQAQLAAIDDQLRTLSARRPDFQRLVQDVDFARQNVALMAKTEVEQEADAAMTETKLSRLQVVQDATIPFEPSSPKAPLFLALSLAVGCFLATLAAILKALMVGSVRSYVRFDTEPGTQLVAKVHG